MATLVAIGKANTKIGKALNGGARDTRMGLRTREEQSDGTRMDEGTNPWSPHLITQLRLPAATGQPSTCGQCNTLLARDNRRQGLGS
jgi:hypothetical protein